MPKDLHVKAWNFVDANGSPVIEIDEEMYHHEYRQRIVGKYAGITARLLRAVSYSDIDRALTEQK